MMKVRRQAKILEIISKYDIETQDELAGHLQEEGFHATQATISRDIRELKLMKVSAGGGHQKYTPVDPGSERLAEKYLRVLRDGFVGMDQAGNLIVIRTVSGRDELAGGCRLYCRGRHDFLRGTYAGGGCFDQGKASGECFCK